MKVAIQGELGAFSHEAARRMVPGCTIVPCARSVDVFDRLKNGSVGIAVIPIENSLAGSVAEHFDLLLARDVFIQKEFRLRIVHNLIAAHGVKLRDIRNAYSHLWLWPNAGTFSANTGILKRSLFMTRPAA